MSVHCDSYDWNINLLPQEASPQHFEVPFAARLWGPWIRLWHGTGPGRARSPLASYRTLGKIFCEICEIVVLAKGVRKSQFELVIAKSVSPEVVMSRGPTFIRLPNQEFTLS